jgi:raffinose/stachyose/melibiose transport system permease protein
MNTKRKPLRADKNAVVISRVFCILYVILTIYPILFVLLTSFKPTAEFYTNIWGLPKTFAAGNYAKAWKVANIGSYMLNSVIVVFSTLVLTLILGSLAGYALSRFHIRGAELIMLLILACTMTPSESVIMPMYTMTAKLGIAGTYLSLILPYVGWGMPMTVYIFRNYFDTLPGELLEAARIDGCTEAGTFFRIAVPLMLPAIATNAIFLFVSWWGELLWASVELSASQMKTIPIGLISFSAQFGTDWGALSAAVCIVLIPLVVFFLFMQKYFIGGLTGGAVKG